MAKMMKKWMALVLALSLMANVVSLPTTAAESADPNVQTVTVDLTNEDGEKIGEKIIITTTDTQEDDDTYEQKVNEQSDWNTQDSTTTESDPVVNGNTVSQVTNTVVEDVTGTENANDNMTSDKNTGIQTLYGDANGSETTTVTDTTTTVTTTTGTQISYDQQDPQTIIDGVAENGKWSAIEQTEEGQWVETGTENGEYKVNSAIINTNHGTTDIDVNDPLADNDVTLNMSQENPTDSEKLFIAIEDALENDITYTEGEQKDGSVVTFVRDDQGNVIGYSILRIKDTTPAGSNTGEITTEAEGGMAPAGRDVITYIKPEGYTEGTQDVVDEAGNVIGTAVTEAIVDDNGNIIGYKITKTVTGSSETLPGTSTENLEVPADVWTLPEKPVANDPVTKEGITTTQIVEDIYENGQHVGYKTITVETDEDGNEKSRSSVSHYGTKTSYTSTLEATPESDKVTTTTVTTVYGTKTTANYTKTSVGTSTNVSTRYLTNEIYELVDTEDGMFMLLEGKVYKVEAIEGHGNVEMNTLQPDLSIAPKTHGDVDPDTDLRGPEKFTVSQDLAEGYDAQYVAYGLESRIKVLEGDGTSTLPHQFVLEDSEGNVHYVYCVDLNTSANRGTSYNMVNVKDSGYFTNDIARKVEGIALTGYWGTEFGTGSLDNLKTYLKINTHLHNLTDSEIDSITEGMALTATQAALWRYGHSKTGNPLGSEVAGPVYNSDSNINKTREPDDEEQKLVTGIYNALINIDVSKLRDTSTELLNTENFATETSLVIKEKATNQDGTTKTVQDEDDQSHDVYVADVVFTVAAKLSDLTGNLVVTVSDEYGNTLATEQIATQDSNLLGKLLAGKTKENGDVEFTIENVELPEGTKINLNLKGVQNLKEGAYLYTAEVYSKSQTFIGVASGTQDVNLNVQMEFNVTDPEAKIQHTTRTWGEKKTDVTNYTKVDRYSRERTGTLTSEEVTVTTEVTGTLVQTDIQTKTTKTHRDWSSSYRYELMPINDEDGGPKKPEETEPKNDDLLEILEEDVPLASAPKTGDLSLVWILMAMICLAGAAMLSRKKTVR